jgi:hypothetical protein
MAVIRGELESRHLDAYEGDFAQSLIHDIVKSIGNRCMTVAV